MGALTQGVDLNARQRAVVAGLAWGIATCVLLFFLRSANWWLSGDDAYFHIRIAAELREQGTLYFQTLDWARMSVFADGWGDKEFLFHVLLIPFAGGDLFAGAKLALSVLNGMAAGTLAYLGVRHAGVAGWLVPLFAVASTAAFTVRMEQLRPHNLSLTILLAIAACAAARRTWLLVLLATAFTLSYTAWQLPLILCSLTFLAFLIFRRERRWELLWAPAIGMAIGIIMHPGFPDNVKIWSLQNFQFFMSKDSLPVGTEIFSQGFVGFARDNWRAAALLALGVVLLWPLTFHKRASDNEITFGVFAAATVALYASAVRFAEYAIPFLALYVVLVATRVRSVRRVPLLARAVLVSALFFGAWSSIRSTATVVQFNHARYGFASLADVDPFRAALPEGARVASTWDFTPFYYFAAPHAEYLNVLDPIFMWTKAPREFTELERLFTGAEADVAGTLLNTLDSEYIAFHRGVFPDLAGRIALDPRMQIVFESSGHSIAKVDTSRSGPGLP